MIVQNFRPVEAEEVEAGAKNVRIRQVITESQGAPHFVMRVFEVGPSGYTPQHSHAWEHEVFILSGSGDVFSANGWQTIGSGDVIFIPGHEIHQFRNSSERPLEFVCLIPTERVCGL